MLVPPNILYSKYLVRNRHIIDNHLINGILLGYNATDSQTYYWVLKTKLINTSKHVIFDEVVNDIENPTSNYRKGIIHLLCAIFSSKISTSLYCHLILRTRILHLIL